MTEEQRETTSTKTFFRVTSDVFLTEAPLSDYLLHGYESRLDFERTLRRLVLRWQNRVGERIDERHDFLLLRFHDTPGGKPDEEWLPRYLLHPADAPPCLSLQEPDENEKELDQAFGFD